MKRVTRKDIAREAGVSETVVSYAMNGNRYVDADKKRRVMEAVGKLGWRPSPIARALKGQKSSHILFIADDLLSGHFGAIISEMERMASQSGMIISLVTDRGRKGFAESVLDWSFDGVVIGSSTLSDDDISKLVGTGIPTVILEIRSCPEFGGRSAFINTGLRKGMQELVRSMEEAGRKRICFVTDEPSERDMRLMGYLDEVTDPIVLRTDDSTDLPSALNALYEDKHFDALIGRTDSTALAAMKALEDAGHGIPSEIAVAGFNDTESCIYSSPSLTSVKIERKRIAEEAMRLLEELSAKEPGETVRVDLEAHVSYRESFVK